MTHTRIQIYTMQSPAEAHAIAALGVDHVGVTPSDRGLPGEVSIETAKDICEAVGGLATSVALSVEDDPETIIAMVRSVGPDVLHLCGLPGVVGPEMVKEIREELQGIGIMQAIAVTGPEAVDEALAYEPMVDYILLDSVDPSIAGVGAAGITHDWEVSAAIVKATKVPVILAGGLGPDNVVKAIESVQPWGVDSLTRTNRPLAGGGFRKDLDAVALFVAAVRGEGTG
ncbi:MAG: phosphoribosylanthranilate isomerase [Armatimonadetes bacterium]|nr:MAG: phosphoribosylanthranilate isomerase [Armatimonadota bacterium]